MANIINAITTGAGGLSTTADASGSIQIATNNGTTAMTIDTSQNVGIGTASPTTKLHVSSGAVTVTGASSTTSRINMFNNAATTNGLLIGQGYSSGTDNVGYVFNVANAPIAFGTNNVERMRIDSEGRFLAGQTTATQSGMHAFTSTNSTTFVLNLSNSSNPSNYWSVGPNASTHFCVFNPSGSGAYILYGGTSWTSNSDERLKTDLKPIENAAEKVSTLRAVTGRFKTDEENVSRSFLIAQDIQAVLPEAVDASNPEKLGVQYTEVIPLLVAAIKEQQTIINDFKTRIETLEAKLG
jgi:hypothetical protein